MEISLAMEKEDGGEVVMGMTIAEFLKRLNLECFSQIKSEIKLN